MQEITLETLMKTMRYPTLLFLLGGLFLSACDDGGPAEPSFDDLSVEEQLTLEFLADPASVDVALSLAEVQAEAAHRRGKMWGKSGDLTTQAENAFRNAENALAAGDRVRALKQARIGRELVAQAVQECNGPRAVQGMVERLQSLPLSVSSDPDAYQDPQGLALQLSELAQGAGNQFRKGKRIQAGGLGVLGEQAVRARQRNQDHALAGLPEVKVELGATAITLAGEILGGDGDEDQLSYLETAAEFQARAEEILGGGILGRAIHYAHLAQWWALKAILVPGEATDEEIGDLLARAQDLFDNAVAAVGAEPTQLQTILLERAASMLAAGEANLSSETCGGLGAIWQAAVISRYLTPTP